MLTHLCHRVCLQWKVYEIYATGGLYFLKNVLLLGIMYLIFTHMPCDPYRR